MIRHVHTRFLVIAQFTRLIMRLERRMKVAHVDTRYPLVRSRE